MNAKTVAEKILSAHAGRETFAGDIVVATVDRILGTDASSPMAIDYFRRMGGERLFDPARVLFALDHYSPPTIPATVAYHDTIRAFANQHGAELHEVGEGISFQLAVELGHVLPGDLIIGADSHTVTCGALNCFATGVGSSDLAAAMITGKLWLRVPASIKVTLTGHRPRGFSAKDLALALVGLIGGEGANYQVLEFHGEGVSQLTLEDRLVVSNLGVEMGAKAAIFPADKATWEYLTGRTHEHRIPVLADPDAKYVKEFTIDLTTIASALSLPHQPDHVVPLADAVGTPIQMVFLGTCTGGRVPDIHRAIAVLDAGGGRVAPGVQLVVTPASREVESRLREDGSLARLEAMGAIITTPGCGACCGTSGVIPTGDMNVMSTANRNFKARMGNATAAIYLASPAACAAAALTGEITEPGAR